MSALNLLQKVQYAVGRVVPLGSYRTGQGLFVATGDTENDSGEKAGG